MCEHRVFACRADACKDKRCVSRELTFSPFASGVMVPPNRHYLIYLVEANNKILLFFYRAVFLQVEKNDELQVSEAQSFFQEIHRSYKISK